MKARISRIKDAPVYTWGETCESFVLLQTQGLSVKQERMPPDTREKLHYHKHAQQFFYILKGEARFFLDEEIVTVSQDEGLHIQAEQRHFIENSSAEVLEFLVISQSATDQDRINI